MFSEMNSRNNLDSLPPEIKSHILSYLNTRDLCSMSGVSRSWRQATGDARLWRNTRLVFSPTNLSSIRELPSVERYKLVKSLRFSGNIPVEDAESILVKLVKSLRFCGNIPAEDDESILR